MWKCVLLSVVCSHEFNGHSFPLSNGAFWRNKQANEQTFDWFTRTCPSYPRLLRFILLHCLPHAWPQIVFCPGIVCSVLVTYLPNHVPVSFCLSVKWHSCLAFIFSDVWVMLVLVLPSEFLENMITIFTMLKIKLALHTNSQCKQSTAVNPQRQRQTVKPPGYKALWVTHLNWIMLVITRNWKSWQPTSAVGDPGGWLIYAIAIWY